MDVNVTAAQSKSKSGTAVVRFVFSKKAMNYASLCNYYVMLILGRVPNFAVPLQDARDDLIRTNMDE